MQNTFLIDGYNLLHALGILTGKVSSGGLERARRQLQDLLAAAFAEEASLVTLVFDASRSPRGAQAEQTYKNLHILFAVGQQEADDLIEALIAKTPSPKHLTVVSSDRRLQTAARRKQAQSLDCAAFLDHLEQRERQKVQPAPSAAEKTEPLSAAEIRHWLQEFAGMEDEPDIKAAFEKFDFESPSRGQAVNKDDSRKPEGKQPRKKPW